MYGMEIATRFLTYVVTLGLTSGQEKILCGDLMFSGHTVVLTIMYFVQLQYTPRGLVWLRWFWLCYWFESDVGDGRLENRWNWPFEGPRMMHDVMRRLNRILE
ncbi:hypothetical protein TELCIR_00482 [Teladorsagia circumcincta]|uniref:Sphingomyelin synthase-like domain-containing protein n=1 Tax=Teladorsagia circumcincta TaxID=45464 RepID=A0A2G9V4I4_TELCI|nr:hypothetical protein TELCIR_00482 [Teladorsagia circumcincta]